MEQFNNSGQPQPFQQHNYYQAPQPAQSTIIVTGGAPKSAGVAFLLAFLFGPLGLLYASVGGGLLMMVLGFIIGIITLGAGFIFAWVGSIIWAIVAVNVHNQNLNKATARQVQNASVQTQQPLSAFQTQPQQPLSALSTAAPVYASQTFAAPQQPVVTYESAPAPQTYAAIPAVDGTLDAKWFYGENGTPSGPVSVGELKERFGAKTLLPNTLLWREGMENWETASTIDEFKAIFAPVPPPMPPQMPPPMPAPTPSPLVQPGVRDNAPQHTYSAPLPEPQAPAPIQTPVHAVVEFRPTTIQASVPAAVEFAPTASTALASISATGTDFYPKEIAATQIPAAAKRPKSKAWLFIGLGGILIAGAAAAAFLLLRSNPLDEGKNAASQLCSCEKEKAKRYLTRRKEFLDKLNARQFDSRERAQEANSVLSLNDSQYELCRNIASSTYQRLQSQYVSQTDKLTQLESGFNAQSSQCLSEDDSELKTVIKSTEQKIRALPSHSFNPTSSRMAVETEENEAAYYVGSIGQAAIHMELSTVSGSDCPRGGAGYKGSYSYDKNGTSQRMKISGYYCGASVYLDEFNAAGQQTGSFIGLQDGDGIEGVWKSADGKKEIPFRVTTPGSAQLVAASNQSASDYTAKGKSEATYIGKIGDHPVELVLTFHDNPSCSHKGVQYEGYYYYLNDGKKASKKILLSGSGCQFIVSINESVDGNQTGHFDGSEAIGSGDISGTWTGGGKKLPFTLSPI